jgi:hypothetical protein
MQFLNSKRASNSAFVNTNIKFFQYDFFENFEAKRNAFKTY